MKKTTLFAFIMLASLMQLFAQEKVNVINLTPLVQGDPALIKISGLDMPWGVSGYSNVRIDPNSFYVPFRKVGKVAQSWQAMGTTGLVDIDVYGFKNQDVSSVYTSLFIDNTLITYDKKIKENNALIDNIVQKIDQMPCQLMLDDNSSCYQLLVKKIMEELEKKYVLVPKEGR